MPLNGLSSFLPKYGLYYKKIKKRVNALNGLSSFLQNSIKQLHHERKVCQYPKRAFFISTKQYKTTPSRAESVSIP